MFRSTSIAALSLAVLALPAHAVEAELKLNGYFAGSLRKLETHFEPQEDQWEGTNNASRISLAGFVKNDYARLFAAYDRGLRNDKNGIEQVRQVYAGVDTAYGQLLGGKKASEYRLSGERLDPFYDTSVVGFNGLAQSEGASYGLSNLSNGYSRNMIAYSTPALFGMLRLNGAAFINDKSAPNDTEDYSGGGSLSLPGLGEDSSATVGAQYLKIRNPAAFAVGNPTRNELLGVGGSPGLSTSYRAYAAYTMPRFSLGLSYENVDVKAEPDPRQYLFAAGTYALTDSIRVAASYGHLAFKSGSPDLSGDGYSLGLFRKVSDSINTYIAARRVDLDGPGSSTSIAAGVSVNFDIKLYPFELFGGGDEEAVEE
ncbi:MAG: hypothetical protein Q8Q73_00220 [Stagnimonas sp.]|nr:hypothetical protein [Stagnimonas sp.]